MIAMIAKIAGIERPKTYHEDTEARRHGGGSGSGERSLTANEREWSRIGKATECHDGGAERGGTEQLEDGANSGREWTLSLTGHGTHVTRVLCGREAEQDALCRRRVEAAHVL